MLLRLQEVKHFTLHLYCTTLPATTSNTFQSIVMPKESNILRASSAIASNPPVAKARIVGPAPERQIPSSPGWVLGVMKEVTSDRPGIYIKKSGITMHHRKRIVPEFSDKAGARDLSSPHKSSRGPAEIDQEPLSEPLTVAS